MPVTEAQRLHLFKSFEGTLAHDDLETLMAMLPPAGWGDMATKRDLDALTVATTRDVDDLRHEMASSFAAVRKDMESLAASTRKDMESLAASTRKDMESLAASTRKDLDAAVSSLRAEMATKDGLQAQTNRYIGWLLGSHAGLAGVIGLLLALD